MKEETLKNLMQQSTVETSDEFTAALMQQVETLEETPTIKVPSFKNILFISVAGLIFVSFISFKYLAPFLSELASNEKMTKTPIFAAVLLLCLLGLNYILRLQQSYRKLY